LPPGGGEPSLDERFFSSAESAINLPSGLLRARWSISKGAVTRRSWAW